MGVLMGKPLPVVPNRPKVRGDCEDGLRPCPWVTCRYHLNTVDADRPTCALDVADDGPHTLEEVAAVMGITRQRVQQIEARAIVRARMGQKG